MPTVSVIVPNYNHAPFLQQRIESILQQTYQDFELILIDDCSTDGSREIMEGYRNNPHVSHIVYGETNSGSAFRQWNKGVELAQGEWVWIAESDDWAEPTFLSTLLDEAQLHPQCGMILSLPRYHYPDGSTWNRATDGTVIEYRGNNFARQQMACANPIHNVSSILMRRNELLQAELSLCTSMRLCGDWMLYAQLCRVTNVLEINRVLSNYRIHSTNVSSRAEQEGLPLSEGIVVLDYLIRHFHIPTMTYARCWGRTWAKQERQHHYSPELRSKIQHLMRPYPVIRLWHKLYQFRLCLK